MYVQYSFQFHNFNICSFYYTLLDKRVYLDNNLVIFYSFNMDIYLVIYTTFLDFVTCTLSYQNKSCCVCVIAVKLSLFHLTPPSLNVL